MQLMTQDSAQREDRSIITMGPCPKPFIEMTAEFLLNPFAFSIVHLHAFARHVSSMHIQCSSAYMHKELTSIIPAWLFKHAPYGISETLWFSYRYYNSKLRSRYQIAKRNMRDMETIAEVHYNKASIYCVLERTCAAPCCILNKNM